MTTKIARLSDRNRSASESNTQSLQSIPHRRDLFSGFAQIRREANIFYGSASYGYDAEWLELRAMV